MECGVHHADGLFSWGHYCTALEPYGINRKIIGFDTFEGFADIDAKDKGPIHNPESRVGGFLGSSAEDISKSIAEFDENRFLNQYPKFQLVAGDACTTIPKYVQENPHLIIALLFLDFDLYEPTKMAISQLVPRMPKGAIICFDEINNEHWPGETTALIETLGIQSLELKSIPFDPNISYAVIT